MKLGEGRAVSRVLIVEDEPAIRTLLAKLLETHGLEVGCAEDGNRALEAMEQGGWDLVLLDLMMPNLDGAAFLGELQRRGIESPPVVITTAAPSQMVSELPKGKVVAVHTKPFDLDRLMETVREAVAAKRVAI